MLENGIIIIFIPTKNYHYSSMFHRFISNSLQIKYSIGKSTLNMKTYNVWQYDKSLCLNHNRLSKINKKDRLFSNKHFDFHVGTWESIKFVDGNESLIKSLETHYMHEHLV